VIEPDLRKKQVQMTFSRQPITRGAIKLDVEKVVTSYQRAQREICERLVDLDELLKDLFEAYTHTLKLNDDKMGARANIVECYRELVMVRQPMAFRRAPAKTSFADYPKTHFIYDIMQLRQRRRMNYQGYRLNLGVSTIEVGADSTRAMFQVFIRSAQSGEIEPRVSLRFRPSVVVQQLCSYIKQTRLGEIDPDQVYELFITPQGEPLIEKQYYNQIIEHLLIKQYFIPARGSALKPGPVWQDLYEERAIYTNLPDPWRGTIDVIDEMTGRKLGEVERGVAPGATFLFDGQARRVTRRIGRKMFVREADEALADAPQLRMPWRPLSYALAQAVAIQLGLPCAGSPTDLAMIPEEERGEANAGDAQTQESTLIPPSAWVFHCAGDAWGVVLGDLLEATYRVKVEDYSDLYLMVRGALPTEPLRFTPEQVFSSLRRRWQQFESWFDLGRFQSQLPREVRRAAVIETFDVTGFLRSLSGRKITRV
jgi:hypothetical protein